MVEFGSFTETETIGEIQQKSGELLAILGYDEKRGRSFVMLFSLSVLNGRLSFLSSQSRGEFETELQRVAYRYLEKLNNT